MIDQGRVIAENTEDGWYIMYPDGSVACEPSRFAAETAVKKWLDADVRSKKHDAGIAVVEWRG